MVCYLARPGLVLSWFAHSPRLQHLTDVCRTSQICNLKSRLYPLQFAQVIFAFWLFFNESLFPFANILFKKRSASFILLSKYCKFCSHSECNLCCDSKFLLWTTNHSAVVNWYIKLCVHESTDKLAIMWGNFILDRSSCRLNKNEFNRIIPLIDQFQVVNNLFLR